MKKFYSVTRPCLFVLLFLFQEARSQTIGTFSSVAPGAQSQSLVIPATHTFQRIIRSGDALTAGGTLGTTLDFTGYVPISGSSLNGYLSISSENSPAAVAIMTVTYNMPTHTWTKSNSGNVNFPVAAFGTVPVARFCSGTVTPNNTIIVSEESTSAGDTNGDGYNDDGWLIEIDPATKSVIESDATHTGVDKLWAIGRQSRENALIMPDNQTLYTGADNGAANSFVYKFVATTPGNFSSGQLYVLVTTAALGTGSWKLLANNTPATRNSTLTQSLAAPAAYSFNGVEDIEVGPIDGKIYFTAKGPGRIYRFTDNGATVSNLEVFVENTTYDVDPGPGVANELWDIGNDNLAFDNEGNLWVLQDGARNHIWVVGPTHTAATPAVRLFGKTPAGSEPTGITFTPDKKFMFISFQHPNAGNATSQLDAAGVNVIFNTHTTIVIARRENLGPTATLPLSFTEFNVQEENNTAQINWSVSNVTNHDYFEVERSTNGMDFEKIYVENQVIANGASQSFSYTDRNLPPGATVVYYRIKEVNTAGHFNYSLLRYIRIAAKKSDISVYPNPAKEILNIDYVSTGSNNISIEVLDGSGRKVFTGQKTIIAGKNILTVDIHHLTKGIYTLVIYNNNKNENERVQFTKL
jgi:secreted PhoX family phosphatase